MHGPLGVMRGSSFPQIRGRGARFRKVPGIRGAVRGRARVRACTRWPRPCDCEGVRLYVLWFSVGSVARMDGVRGSLLVMLLGRLPALSHRPDGASSEPKIAPEYVCKPYPFLSTQNEDLRTPSHVPSHSRLPKQHSAALMSALLS